MGSISVAQGISNVGMLGIGAYRPSRVVTNEEICENIDSSDEWIYSRSGIKNRRFAGEGESLIELASFAAERAIESAGIDPQLIDLLVLCSGTVPSLTPHGAPSVASSIGLNGIPGFDIAAGCSGFNHGLTVAADAIRAGTAHYALVIGAERMHETVNPKDRSSAFIFGDGAGAVVVGPTEENGIGPVVWGTDGDNAAAIRQDISFFDYFTLEHHERLKIDRPWFVMEGPRVFRWAAFTLEKALKRTMEVSGITPEQVEVFIPHQANSRINDLLRKHLGFGEDVPVANDIENTGNTSAASVPLAMEELLRTGKAKEGQLALTMGFGAGLAYAGHVVRLPKPPVTPSA